MYNQMNMNDKVHSILAIIPSGDMGFTAAVTEIKDFSWYYHYLQ